MKICIRILCRLKFFWIILLLLFFSFSSAYAYNAGFTELFYNPDKDRIIIALWYPTEEMEQPVSYWSWKGNAAHKAEIKYGKYPLLLFSHGFDGSRFNQAYLAEFMARNGYMVAAIEHCDEPGLQNLINRSRNISKVLDFILTEPSIKNSIDSNKIGVVGHYLGGFTALTLARGMPDFSKYPYPSLDKFKKIDNNFYDNRIKAIAILAPGFIQMFDKNSLTKVDIPVLVIEAEKDEVIDSSSISTLKDNLPNLHEYFILKGAGHYAFLPISNTEYLKSFVPELCYDPGLPREELHPIIEEKILDFFKKIF